MIEIKMDLPPPSAETVAQIVELLRIRAVAERAFRELGLPVQMGGPDPQPFGGFQGVILAPGTSLPPGVEIDVELV